MVYTAIHASIHTIQHIPYKICRHIIRSKLMCERLKKMYFSPYYLTTNDLLMSEIINIVYGGLLLRHNMYVFFILKLSNII